MQGLIYNLAAMRKVRIRPSFKLRQGQDLNGDNWPTGGMLEFEVCDKFRAWHGHLPVDDQNDWQAESLQRDREKFNELVSRLRPVANEDIYPMFPFGEVARYEPHMFGVRSAPTFKGPSLWHYEIGTTDIAARLLREARIHETIARDPHPNLDTYYGCVEDDGRIVRLAVGRYVKPVCELFAEELPPQKRRGFIEQVEAGVSHLHCMGLAHNDISKANVMVNSYGQPVLTDFSTCIPVGYPVAKVNQLAVTGNGFRVSESSVGCDLLAIEDLRAFIAALPERPVE